MSNMNEREFRKQQVAKLMAQGAKGASIIAKSMTQPLRMYQDYSSVGRRAFLVETLAQGQDPLLDLDVSGGIAYVVSDLGRDISRTINPETMRVHINEIASNPSISYTQLVARKYDVKARIEQFSRAEIFRVEDRLIFQALLATATHKYQKPIYQTDKNGNNPITIGDGGETTIEGNPVNPVVTTARKDVSISHISEAMAQIEKHGGLKATNIFMNPKEVTILRNMNINNANGYYVSFDISNELMRTGMVATIYGLNVYVTPEIPVGTMIVTAEPDFVGRIIQQIPLTVIPYELPEARKTGFSIFESIGVLIHNPKAVCAIKIS